MNYQEEKEALNTISSCLKHIVSDKKRTKARIGFNYLFFVIFFILMFIVIWATKGEDTFGNFFKHITEQNFILQVIALMGFCWLAILIVQTILYFRSWKSSINVDALNKAIEFADNKQKETQSSTDDSTPII
jgi:polyferredoxin